VPLNVISNYSLIGGYDKKLRRLATSSPEDLVRRVKALSYDQFGLVDSTFAGLGSALSAAVAENIKFNPGILLPFYEHQESEPTLVTLLAQTTLGLYLLYNWFTQVHAEGMKLPLSTLSQTQPDEKIISFLSDQQPVVHETLENDNTYYALTQPFLNARQRAQVLKTIPEQKMVVMHPVVMATAQKLPTYNYLEAVHRGKHVLPVANPLNHTLKTPLEISTLYPHSEAAMARAKQLADSCQVTFPRRPETKAVIAEGRDSYEFFEELVMEKLLKKQAAGRNLESLTKRVKHELYLIKELGFADYLLICYEVAEYCHQQNIEFMVSGSGNNSVVLWVLGVVKTDPQSRLFERFINSERTASLPDVDFLLPYDKVATVMEFLTRRYPEEATRMAIIQRMKEKSIINLATKANYPLTRELYQQLLADELPHQLSTHASGEALIRHAPKQRMPKGPIVVFNKDDVEKNFVVPKIDLLSNDAVTHIADTMELLANDGIEVSIEPNDPLVLQRLFTGKTLGITGLESPHMDQVLRAVYTVTPNPTLKNIDIALALARLDYQGRQNYLKSKQEKHPFAEYPELKAILSSTRYVAIYQEQLVQIAREIAGFSWPDADKLRKMMSEETSPAEKNRLLEDLSQALTSKEYPPQIIAELQRQLSHFKSYTFVEGHSEALADLSYRQGFLRDAYPNHYFASIFRRIEKRSSGMLYPLQTYVNEFHRLGLEFAFDECCPPERTVVKDGKVVLGRHFFGPKRKGFEDIYAQFLALYQSGSNLQELLQFQMRNFRAVLTHNPVEFFPKNLHFDPAADRQEIVARVATKRLDGNRYYVSLDSTELIHAQLSTQLKFSFQENAFYHLEIGRSANREGHWIILRVFSSF
jgi:DNA polymerase III alpha subunit